ncbi:formate/nitrite transporter family protein [Pseudaestuariivita atlantica]|uniref:Transporter (Formate/nitrite transporter family protein) n=1 Tax=Pseudaestuariivita atlantica TaxID=1317121 RepID=A0A0L1JNE2_9RHOB|nr:formate/nitrite transporter family protein [Pseudaestuariivita atlantica]KNG93232.1 transporter (formate/nitrite transporter family protein) [Pseudaestuariivita atlantica]
MANIPADDQELTREFSEREAVEQATGLSARLVFETIRREGEEELRRPALSLFWSGVAAGILISFSVLAEAALRISLPDVPWRHIVENFGYSMGFLLVILGRMQLFTENTITTVVPTVIDPRGCITCLLQLWGIVLVANVIGAFAIATFLAHTPVLSPELSDAVTALSVHATHMEPLVGFVRGIPAGILIAALVWMLPSAQGGQVALIVLFTWLIALGDFTHIIAGSVEMAFLLVTGDLSIARATFGFFIPVLAGNVVGGTLVFTMLTWAQVRHEMSEE